MLVFVDQSLKVAVSLNSSPSFIKLYKQDGESFIEMTAPSPQPNGASYGVRFSEDNTYLGVGSNQFPAMTVYKNVNDVFVAQEQPNLPGNGSITDVDFSQNNLYFASIGIGITALDTRFMIHKMDGSSFSILFSQPDIRPGYGQGVRFSNNNDYLAVAGTSSPYIHVYKRTNDVFNKIADANFTGLPPTNASESSNDISFSGNDGYVALATNLTPFVYIYKRDGDTFTKLDNPSVLPTGIAIGVCFSNNSDYLVVAHVFSTRSVTIYKRDGDTFTKLSDLSIPSATARRVAFSKDDNYLAITIVSEPGLLIYERSGDNFTQVATPNINLPNAYGVAFTN
jgi:WD40 repeat protein